MPRGTEKTIVITGGAGGMGFEAVKHFLALGYNVILGASDTSTAATKLNELKESGNMGTGKYELYVLDLSSLDSVRAFAQKVLDKNVPINILLNNAEIVNTPHHKTKDGLESQMGVNHMSHFLLSHLLMRRLIEGGNGAKMARIINTTSYAHRYGSWIDFDDIHCKNFYTPKGQYGNSKVMQVMFTFYLNKVLVAQRAKVRVLCFHPGFGASDKRASDALLHAALTPDLEGKGGLYLENMKGTNPSRFSRNVENQKKMWNISCNLTGIDVADFGGFK